MGGEDCAKAARLVVAAQDLRRIEGGASERFGMTGLGTIRLDLGRRHEEAGGGPSGPSSGGVNGIFLKKV
jgi:hypothetical protein